MSPQRNEPVTLPLRPHVFHILLALSGGDLHGLGIADEVERSSEGLLELGPGTLYRTLAELTDGGLIRSAPAPDADADPRRKYYRITRAGRALLVREVGRMKRVVGLAAKRVVADA